MKPQRLKTTSRALALVLLLVAVDAQAADALRLAVQKTGTSGWELAVVKAFGLDKAAGLDLAVSELASTDASKIAIQGGSADIVISDWLWVARERAQGGSLTFYPYSTAIGAVMTKDPAIKTVADLAGKKLGVAGGPVDKAWLLLKAFALKQGVDLEKTVNVSYGAPPLLAQKAAQGELDAVLEFWNFAVDLEIQGFRRAIELSDVEKALGAQGNAIVTGYVFDEKFAQTHPHTLARFLAMTKKAKELIATSEEAWKVVVARTGISDKETLDLYRKRYVAGLPKRGVAAEEADAARLFAVLAKLGGEKLVGPSMTLPAGTFYRSRESAAP
jgi:NitT/TauT family transport system substrate-binding protein